MMYAVIFVYSIVIIIIIVIVISVMEELFQENTYSEYTVFDFNLNNLFG